MRLVDLNPRDVMDADIVVGGQVVHDENRRGMGVSFDCPHCRALEKSSSQFTELEIVLARVAGTIRVDADCLGWIGPKPLTRLGVFFANPADGKPPSDDGGPLWTRTGEDYATMSISPSIDASKHGHWHGTIANGEVG